MKCGVCGRTRGIVTLVVSPKESSPDPTIPREEWEEITAEIRVYWCTCGALWTQAGERMWFLKSYQHVHQERPYPYALAQ